MKNRPLSPHLTIYKSQITSIVSIFHRISGSVLSLSFMSLALILSGDVVFSEYYLFYNLSFKIGIYFYWFLATLGYFSILFVFFHLSNGIRHLIWDLGIGLEIKNVYITGFIVLAITSLMVCILIL
jgi:succinate dehydrogenase / fumarate reductase cytochrome b subunit